MFVVRFVRFMGRHSVKYLASGFVVSQRGAIVHPGLLQPVFLADVGLPVDLFRQGLNAQGYVVHTIVPPFRLCQSL